MLFNTTTQETQIDAGVDFFSQCMFMLGTLTSSTLFTLLFFEYYFFKTRDRESESESESDSESDSESESESESEDSEVAAAFKALPRRELSENELADLEMKIVEVDTAGGQVIMTYHKPTEAFWYYTDHLKDVSYRMLETVAQQFVVKYDCKCIYV